MEESVLELITQALTENRITDKVYQSEEYKRAKEEEGKVYNTLISDLNEEQKQRLDDFIGSTTWSAAIWERMAYQQGMRDFLELLKSLL
jgi:hypothetical protein